MCGVVSYSEELVVKYEIYTYRYRKGVRLIIHGPDKYRGWCRVTNGCVVDRQSH